jgi:hypothetical protein
MKLVAALRGLLGRVETRGKQNISEAEAEAEEPTEEQTEQTDLL